VTSSGTDDGDLKSKMLEAAIDEFAEFGLAGARVDRIATRAGANKQLIYYYFTDKDGLFDAAVKHMAGRFREVRAGIPVEPKDQIAAYFTAAAHDHKLIRLLQWEALAIGEGKAIDEAARTAWVQAGVNGIRQQQSAGDIPKELDAAQLFLSFQALSSHPFAFTQMTRFITGRNASDPKFQKDRVKFLKLLGARIFRP
jgi:TetR/AcrR family transcriptional regulator